MRDDLASDFGALDEGSAEFQRRIANRHTFTKHDLSTRLANKLLHLNDVAGGDAKLVCSGTNYCSCHGNGVAKASSAFSRCKPHPGQPDERSRTPAREESSGTTAVPCLRRSRPNISRKTKRVERTEGWVSRPSRSSSVRRRVLCHTWGARGCSLKATPLTDARRSPKVPPEIEAAVVRALDVGGLALVVARAASVSWMNSAARKLLDQTEQELELQATGHASDGLSV